MNWNCKHLKIIYRQILDLKRQKTEINEKKEQFMMEKAVFHYDQLSQMFYEDKGFPLLTPSYMYQKDESFGKELALEDLVMVHATDVYPRKNVIAANNQGYTNRNTVHTALNGRVSSHKYGNWDKCKIIIIEPLKNHIKQVVSLLPADTFTYGSIFLSEESLILIDADSFDEIYKQNKEDIDSNKNRIILYRGDSSIVTDNILMLLGYKPQSIGNQNWLSCDNLRLFNEWRLRNYPYIESNLHNGTVYSILEKTRKEKNYVTSHIKTKEGKYASDTVISLNELWILFVYFIKHKQKYYLQDENQLIRNITSALLNKSLSKYENYSLNDIEMYLNKHNVEAFIREYGIMAYDNEIHLLGYKEHIKLYDGIKYFYLDSIVESDDYESNLVKECSHISDFQIEKIMLLLRKYGLMKQKDMLKKSGHSK